MMLYQLYLILQIIMEYNIEGLEITKLENHLKNYHYHQTITGNRLMMCLHSMSGTMITNSIILKV